MRGAARRRSCRAGGAVGEAVDQDEGAGRAVLVVGVERDRLAGGEVAEADLVQREPARGVFLERVDVDAVPDRGDGARRPDIADAHEVGAPGQHRLLVHPQQMAGELVGDRRAFGGADQDVAARDIDLVLQRERHRLAGLGGVAGRHRR